ncbi:uncharacterized protein JN550_004304 [Neoarthrinium moseri]|uniref:uncharacterized protein n=1 Tax=Neoarthrinium moseri TaxID=1658444 RepID=UPI001FDB0B88|nr:uncharacterized protein JN550_004304 [Neoarthrinium moseri]KAI1872101.1 hypothetical protein JN550_004304 [Neoarthrinium moseri]
MLESSANPRVGVAALIRNEQGKIIVGKRLASHGTGAWAVPGGHLEFGESHFACAERETLEETGLEVKGVKIVAVTNDVFEDLGKHYITIFVECARRDATQEPRVIEVDKCEEWRWTSWEELLDWQAQQEKQDNECSGQKLFLPMRNLLRDYYPQISKTA